MRPPSARSPLWSYSFVTHGRRLRVSSTVGETVTITARLSRAGSTIAKKTQGAVAAGARTVELRVPRATAGGSARLTMTFADASGAKKIVRRTVTVPARRRG